MVFIANELTQISPKDVVVFSNCDEVKLFWDDELIASKKVDRNQFKNLPHPPFIFKNLFEFTAIKHRGRGKKTNHKMTAQGLLNGKVVTTTIKNYARRTEKIRLEVDHKNIQLTADGSDFLPIRAIICDEKGNRKVLADDEVFFKVSGEGEIIGGVFNNGNPVKASLGIATALLKATTKAGKIEIRAFSNGLESDIITLNSIPSILPLFYDEFYALSSKKADNTVIKIEQKNDANNLPKDVKTLQEKLKKLQLELIGKEQDIMDLRSKVKGKKN